MISISCAFGLLTIGNAIIDFLKYEVVTKVNRVHDMTSLFPSVTFCTRHIERHVDRYKFFNTRNKTNDGSFVKYETLTDKDCLRFNAYQDESTKLLEVDGDGVDFSLSVEFKYLADSQTVTVHVNDNYLEYFDGIFEYEMTRNNRYHLSFYKGMQLYITKN